jgi:hypothetical protein
MDNQLPKGLSLNEINDEYRMRRAKRLHCDDVKISSSYSAELYAEPCGKIKIRKDVNLFSRTF